jgi:hypothetical protein
MGTVEKNTTNKTSNKKALLIKSKGKSSLKTEYVYRSDNKHVFIYAEGSASPN